MELDSKPHVFTAEEQTSHDHSLDLLGEDSIRLDPSAIPSVVSLRDVVEDTPEPDEPLSSLVVANRGHNAVFKALEQLEQLDDSLELHMEKSIVGELTNWVVAGTRKKMTTATTYSNRDEDAAATATTTTTETTTSETTISITTNPFTSSEEALNAMELMGSAIPRRVCQHPFRRNDIVWVCRTCQSDETCVLCHACYKASNHEGHDVAFYHAQAGGCCDCGDPDAWDPEGFCPHHGPMMAGSAGAAAAAAGLPTGVVPRVRGLVPACGEWLVNEICRNSRVAQQRPKAAIQPARKSNYHRSSSLPTPIPPAAETAEEEQQGGDAASRTHNNRRNTRSHFNAPTGRASFDAMVNDLDSDTDDEMFDTDREDDDIDDNDVDQSMMMDYGHVFSPSAASTSKSRHGSTNNDNNNNNEEETKMPTTAADSGKKDTTLTSAQRLGITGREGHGLYLVLHADDIHTPAQLVEALRDLLGPSSYYTDSLLQRLVRALRNHGQIVIWGTMELLAECSSNLVNLWLDGDVVASGKLGAVMLERASRLLKHDLVCSIYTRDELRREQRAVAVLQWLTQLARSCDPLCQTVAESLLADEHLVPMLRADFQLCARVTKAWHSLLLTLLAVPVFKSRLAAAYCDTYRHVTGQYARGMGVLERSGYTLSVQFLNRVTYVVGLVQGRDLLGKLGKSLLETLSVASKTYGRKIMPRLDPNHFVLTHRRYSPCISDLKCVLNVKGMARLFASTGGTFLEDWVQSLTLAQNMDGQIWRSWTQGHVEVEPRGWVGSFNASISLGSIFERLLSWDDEDKSPITDPSSPLSGNLLNCVELTIHVLTKGLGKWQKAEMMSYEATPNSSVLDAHKRCSASLPFSSVGVRHGSALAMRSLPVSQVTWWSFHLPLHRFVAACLREVCRRPSDKPTHELMEFLHNELPKTEQDLLFRGLMEFPTLVLSRSAQVRTGLWRRNGPGMSDQVLNYAEPPFCRALRDADLLLLQFAVLGRKWNQSSQGKGNKEESDVGCCFLVNLLLHRYGLFQFAGLSKAPNENITRYQEEVEAGLYAGEVQVEEDVVETGETESSLVLPWTYTPAKDVATSLSLLEEFFHILIVFITELPPVPAKDKEDHTNQAKLRLRREVVHRLASGAKTHSELAEVHHVLSHWDNVFLSEEGKARRPDDGTGAALETALSDVAERKSSRGRLAPDQWELKRSAWKDYDPAFFHMSLRSHQSAAENRPVPPTPKSPVHFGVEPQTYAPPLEPFAHCAFHRLRRDVTADATALAITYRILHVHCRNISANQPLDTAGLRGKTAYDKEAMSETILARAVHFLTLGAYAWKDDSSDFSQPWRNKGGGSVGSIFYGVLNDAPAPTINDWIAAVLLAKPSELMDDNWYDDEENALLLLKRLAVDGGSPGGFIAQDKALRAGAAWLCELAIKHNPDAAKLVGAGTQQTNEPGTKGETDMERRRREAKARAMQRMEAQRAKFLEMMKVDDSDDDDDGGNSDPKQPEEESLRPPRTPTREPSPSVSSSIGSECGSANSSSTPASPARNDSVGMLGDEKNKTDDATNTNGDENIIPARLLKERPQCIICVDDGSSNARGIDSSSRNEGEDENRKRSRRKNNNSNALGFVGYVQASTVRKGGYPSVSPPKNAESSVQRFVGAHVSLCGHAIHSECCEAYLASVSHREDRTVGRREEFRCPLCQRLSNCLVPFIDVGVDWIESPTCIPVSNDNADKSAGGNFKSCDDDAMSVDMECENDSEQNPNMPLHDFLSTTPWWVSRDDNNVTWDGQCAFIGTKSLSTTSSRSASEENLTRKQGMTVDASPLKSNRRRGVRSLRKKDLYTAWNAMMRTPRFMRKRHRNKNSDMHDTTLGTAAETKMETVPKWPVTEDSSGETVVWRRLIDLLSDVTYRADTKRLGDMLPLNFGEFRHYLVEKDAYNVANRAAGIESVDWPACISTATLPDGRRQELSREKLLAKLLMSIQSLTYTCCSEVHEARRLFRKLHIGSVEDNETHPYNEDEKALYSKFGIAGFSCDGHLVLMAQPSSLKDEGTQPFDGRLGKIRHLGLAVMAAAGAVSADLVQLVLAFPLCGTISTDTANDDKSDSSSMDVDTESSLRAPVVYPILYGHVLTHVVAAICASCGRARARSDSLEFVWPVPFSQHGSFSQKVNEVSGDDENVDILTKECESFIKLGFLARILQVLLGKLGLGPQGNFWGEHAQKSSQVLEVLKQSFKDFESKNSTEDNEKWMYSCFKLLEVVLSPQNDSCMSASIESSPDQKDLCMTLFRSACFTASVEAGLYLGDAGTILQILLPGTSAKYGIASSDSKDSSRDHLCILNKLRAQFGIESIETMMKSPRVCELMMHWYRSALNHAENSEKTETAIVRGASLESRLFKTDGFRVMDWPMQSAESMTNLSTVDKPKSEETVEPHSGNISSSQVESFSTRPEKQWKPGPILAYSTRKSVPLLGGFYTDEGRSNKGKGHPRISMLPTSYTDLYDELGKICPDSEQTGLCLVCGEVLNAGGKGECTKHSFKCGAGAGIFFLLQECVGLIMHGGKAAYVHSPYVDSHGETPQYRGRPLNLDLDRYDILQELWSGHTVRQKVLAERASSRQVIIPDFY